MVLGKRKSVGAALAMTGSKRRKLSVCSDYTVSQTLDQTSNPFAAIHLPAQNARSSPLLRLPAELRAQIWQHAYGTLKIHVHLRSLNKPAQESHKHLTYHLQAPSGLPILNATPFLPAPASKQFLSEATTAFYASSTFTFPDTHSFRAFALSPHPCVPQTQHITIPQLDHRWHSALTASLVGRLKGLRGVNLTYRSCVVGERAVLRISDTEIKAFWRVVRAFQQHGLEARRSRFEIVLGWIRGFRDGEWDNRVTWEWGRAEGLQKELTEGLVRLAPRRLSRRVIGEK